MDDQDEDEFLEFARSTGDVVIISITTDQPGEEFPSFRSLAGRRLGEGCQLWNRSISPQPIVEYYEVHGGYYCVDFLQSEVVNAMRSKREENSLSRGRLHNENDFLRTDGAIAEKSTQFVRWFDQLRRWIRKTYPVVVDGAYASFRAEALAKSGVELTGHRF
ncbi:hypothetical protein C5Y93_07595 [Blastopirellula marina]|uniref:Uncharacterized protein n=2 Tax=Blastopirellula marina TaxID=124 RepID=A0A2S8GQI3_9BACT|nr:hypothetical protein C5Y93_07595 [Blastopirellula marina]